MIELDKGTRDVLSFFLNKYRDEKPLFWNLISRLKNNHSLQQPIVDEEISLLLPIIRKEWKNLMDSEADHFIGYSPNVIGKLMGTLNEAERKLDLKV